MQTQDHIQLINKAHNPNTIMRFYLFKSVVYTKLLIIASKV